MSRFTIFAALLALLLSFPLVAQGKPKPLPRDIPSLKALAEKGDAEAQYQLADKFYYGEGIEKDYAQSFKWASQSATQDNPKAQYRLATLYQFGRGTPKDENKAHALFKQSEEGLLKLAEQKNPRAQFNLGNMYRLGRGVEKNEKKAAEWYQKAAAQNYPRAQFNLGNM